MPTEPPCEERGRHTHQATMENQAAADAWVSDTLRAHPKFHLGLPLWQYGPPQRIEPYIPRPKSGAIGRVVQLEGPVTIGITLEEIHAD